MAVPDDGTGAKVRFDRGVEVPEGVIARLRGTCVDVDTSIETTTDAGRDWWPLAMVWARAGEVPARAGVVVRPATTGEVGDVLRVANEARIPVTASAGRSGVCGASVPVFGGIVVDLTGVTGVTNVDDASMLVDVRAGTFGNDFEQTLRAEHGLTLGHWPQSIELSTVGGWLACRSAGQYSTRYGKIEDMVVGLDVVLADGSVIATGGHGPRQAVGPDLTQLFVGSEGTLGVITEARLRAHPAPISERRAAYGFRSFEAGLEICRRILRRGATPAVLRLYDHRESKRHFEIENTHVLIVLDEGEPLVVDAVMQIVGEECAMGGAAELDEGFVGHWLQTRNDVGGLASTIERDVIVDTCEVAAPWAALPNLYVAAIAGIKAVPGSWVASAHQSHAYTDGACLYFTFAGQREGDPDGYYADAWDAVTAATMAAGGSISHHHGIGLNRGRFMADALGPAFATLQTVKDALDPNGILNPGKLGLRSPFGPPVPWPA